MGIAIPNNEILPFQLQGSTVFFMTRFPTDTEMEEYPHDVITSNTPWDPQSLIMPGGIEDTLLTTMDCMAKGVSYQQFHGQRRDHQLYKTDCASYSIDGNTEQLLLKQMIGSIHVASVAHMNELMSKTRHSNFTPEHVAHVFNVNLGTAKDILATTTQKGVRHAVMPLNRRYCVNHLHPHHNYLAGKWTMDHIEFKYKSIRGHTDPMVFLNGNLVMVFPTATKNDKDSTESLRQFAKDIGIPANLTTDMATAFVGRQTSFQTLVRKLGINMMFSKPHCHNQLQQVNVAICEVKQ
jgi:hypothetical protein